MSPGLKLALRIGALVALVTGLFIAGRYTRLGEALSRDNIRAAVAAAGAWGPPLYIAALSAAMLLHVPGAGILFVALAAALYGRAAGGALALAGSFVGVTVSFAIVRAVGGTPLAAVQRPLLKKLLARLETRPITTIAVLRLCFFVSAPLNYALALSGVRPRDYVVGSGLGLIPPVIVLTVFFQALLG